jgi:uncharacterized protein (TIGR01777 family)
MKIIITGGTGLIGRKLVTELHQHGHQIVVLSRSPDKHRSSFPADIQLAGWDAKTAAGWGEQADGADAIINLAGENTAGDYFLPARWNDKTKHKIRQSRLDAGQAVVEAVRAARQKPKVVVQASAVGYYGPRNEPALHDEHTPPGNDFLAQTSIVWEQSTAAVKEMGLCHIILRTGLVLTKKGGSLPRLLLPFKLFVGGYFGSGQQWWPWIHFQDEIRAICFLVEKEGANGPYNLTAPNPKTNREFGKTMGRVLKRPSLIPVPAFAMRLLVGEVATVVLDGQRAIPKRLQEAGFDFQFNELEPALRDLLK